MKIKIILPVLLLLISLSSNAYAEQFHCRITEVQDFDTRDSVNSSPKMEEFVTKTNNETDIYFAGEVVSGISGYEGSQIVNTKEYTSPFIVISKLDNKFFDMYLYRKPLDYLKGQGFLVSGFCKEVSILEWLLM